MQMWTVHLFPKKTFEMDSTPTLPKRVSGSLDYFSVQIWIFHLEILVLAPPPSWWQALEATFHADLEISFNS